MKDPSHPTTFRGSFILDGYARALLDAHPGDVHACAPPGAGVEDPCGCIGAQVNGRCVSDGYDCVSYTITAADVAETLNEACKLGVREFALWGGADPAAVAAFKDVVARLPDCP